MFRRLATNGPRATLCVQARTMMAYSLFMKQVHKTNKFPAVKTAVKALINGRDKKAFAKAGRAMGNAWRALPLAQRKALSVEAAQIKYKKPRTQKAKYFKKMKDSPLLKGTVGAAKQKKLAQLWAKRQGHSHVSPLGH